MTRAVSLPRVSVVIPTFDRETMLGSAIESVLAQHFRDFECIVVDDGSRDRSVQLVESIRDPRVRLARNEKNLGIPASRNRGVALARGEYVALLDSDDRALPGRLQEQIAFLDAHPEVAGVGSWFRAMDAGGRAERTVRRCPLTRPGLRFALCFSAAPRQSTLMFRRELLLAEPWDESCSVSEDLELFGRVAARHELRALPRALTLLRRHAGRITQAPRPERDAIRRRVIGTRLRELGLAPDPDELELHMRLSGRQRGREAVSDALLRRAGPWLETLACRIGQGGGPETARGAALHPEVAALAAARWYKLLRSAARQGRPTPLEVAPHLSAALGPRAAWLRALRTGSAVARRGAPPC